MSEPYNGAIDFKPLQNYNKELINKHIATSVILSTISFLEDNTSRSSARFLNPCTVIEVFSLFSNQKMPSSPLTLYTKGRTI